VERFLSFSGRPREPVQIAFFGGNFLGLHPRTLRRLLEAATTLVREGKARGIRFSTRSDTVDDARLSLLASYPVAAVEIGAQSMDDAVLEQNGRGHTSAATEEAVGRLQKRGVPVGVQLMAGLPGDTPAGEVETARRVADLRPDFVRIYPTVVLRGSLLANEWRRGRYRPLGLEEAVERVKEMVRVFRSNRIPVVRMGLAADEELSGGALLDGPFHPAFGYLVQAALFLDEARSRIAAAGRPSGETLLRVHPRSLSRMQGLRKGNLRTLEKEFGLTAVRVKPDPGMSEDAVRLETAPESKELAPCDCAAS
jgi:histone acetyltransferase (RNA polymerase elongator complex component)